MVERRGRRKGELYGNLSTNLRTFSEISFSRSNPCWVCFSNAAVSHQFMREAVDWAFSKCFWTSKHRRSAFLRRSSTRLRLDSSIALSLARGSPSQLRILVVIAGFLCLKKNNWHMQWGGRSQYFLGTPVGNNDVLIRTPASQPCCHFWASITHTPKKQIHSSRP